MKVFYTLWNRFGKRRKAPARQGRHWIRALKNRQAMRRVFTRLKKMTRAYHLTLVNLQTDPWSGLFDCPSEAVAGFKGPTLDPQNRVPERITHGHEDKFAHQHAKFA